PAPSPGSIRTTGACRRAARAHRSAARPRPVARTTDPSRHGCRRGSTGPQSMNYKNTTSPARVRAAGSFCRRPLGDWITMADFKVGALFETNAPQVARDVNRVADSMDNVGKAAG